MLLCFIATFFSGRVATRRKKAAHTIYWHAPLSQQMSDDNTDTILGGVTAGFLALCGICVVVSAWRARRPVMKVSRSDPDLESLQNIVADSLPSHK
jgi:hypothetical protein